MTFVFAIGVLPTHAFDLQGHRGARGLAPENTLPAFARALEIGVTTLELDVGVTRDGVVVAHHDRRLNPDIARGPDGRWLQAPTPRINALSLRELQRYDIGRIRPGSEYSRRFPDQKRMDGVRIPTLASVLQLARRAEFQAVRFNIETKISPLAPEETLPPEAFARAVIAAVREAGMQHRSTLQSFDWRTLATVQRDAPEIGTVYLSSQRDSLDNIAAGAAGGSPWTAGLRHADHGSVPQMVKAAGGGIWSPYYGDITRGLLAEARSLGLRVIVWTVNAPEDMQRLIDWGVDGIITDYPDLLKELLAARGIPVPQGGRPSRRAWRPSVGEVVEAVHRLRFDGQGPLDPDDMLAFLARKRLGQLPDFRILRGGAHALEIGLRAPLRRQRHQQGVVRQNAAVQELVGGHLRAVACDQSLPQLLHRRQFHPRSLLQ